MADFIKDMERKYKALQNLANKDMWARRIVGSLLLVLFLGAPIAVFIGPEPFLLSIQVLAMMIVIPISLGVFIIHWSKRYNLKKEQKIFFNFYKMDEALQKFIDVKSKQNKKDAKKAVSSLAYYVGTWAGIGPSSLNELPKDINKNLRKKIIPLIDQEKFETISIFRNKLFNFFMRFPDKEPSIEDLKYFNDGLKSILELEVTVTEEKQDSFFQKYPPMKYIWLSPLGGGIFFFALIQLDPTSIHSSLGYSVPTGLGILVAIITIFKRKS